MKKLILAAALPALLAGCYVAGRGRVEYAYESPPPPRYMVVEDRPGYVWVDGHWYWGSDRWLWNDGYYVVDRPGYVYVQGAYRGRSYHPGYWNTRSYYRPGPSQAGNVIRSGGRSEARGVFTPSSPSRSYSAPVRSGGGPSRAGSVIRDHR